MMTGNTATSPRPPCHAMLCIAIAILMVHGSNGLTCGETESKVKMRIKVEFKSLKLKSFASHKERAYSTERYREESESLEVSASQSGSLGIEGIGSVSSSLSASYAHANMLITNNKNSGSWKETTTITYQDGWHIFRNIKTQITTAGVTANTEEEDYVFTGSAHENQSDLRKRANAYLEYEFPDERSKIRNGVYTSELCAKNRPNYITCTSGGCGVGISASQAFHGVNY